MQTMRFVIILVLVLALFIWVFSLILSSGNVDMTFVEQWRKMTPAQQLLVALSRLPWRGRITTQDRTLSVPEDFGPVRAESEATPLSWETLASFDWQPGTKIPPAVQAIHGQYVELEGFLLALEENDPVGRYVLGISLWGLCSDPQTPLSRMVLLRTEQTPPVSLRNSTAIVTGRISVGLETMGGIPVSLYRIEVTKLEEPDYYGTRNAKKGEQGGEGEHSHEGHEREHGENEHSEKQGHP
jgi:hypothetical protein